MTEQPRSGSYALKFYLNMSGRSFTEYYTVQDRLSQALLGYAFFDYAAINIYDRSGRHVRTLFPGERPLETPLLDPIDFIAGGIAGKLIGKKVVGQGVRTVEEAIESDVARETAEGSIAGTPRVPPFENAPPGGSILKGNLGTTTPWGDIYLSSRLVPGSAEWMETLGHEYVHHLLSPRITSVFGRSRGLMKAWFYKNSHLLKFTEEALAESVGTLNLRRGLVYAYREINGAWPRLVLEGGLYTGVLGGAFAGGVELSPWRDRP